MAAPQGPLPQRGIAQPPLPAGTRHSAVGSAGDAQTPRGSLLSRRAQGAEFLGAVQCQERAGSAPSRPRRTS